MIVPHVRNRHMAVQLRLGRRREGGVVGLSEKRFVVVLDVAVEEVAHVEEEEGAATGDCAEDRVG